MTQAEITISLRVVKTTVNEENVNGDLKLKTPMTEIDLPLARRDNPVSRAIFT